MSKRNPNKPNIRIAISGPQGSGKTEILQRVYKALSGAEFEVVDLDNGRNVYGPRARLEIYTTNMPLPEPEESL